MMPDQLTVQGRLLVDPALTPMPGWLHIDDGVIAEVGFGDPPTRPDIGDSDAIISPGFIDAHVHLPQFEVIGYDGLNLLDWLEQIIFPAELRWSSAQWAAEQIALAHRRMLRSGTLGYAGFLTSHTHGLGLLTDALRHRPMRALAGQVLMDRAGPSGLLDQPLAPMRESADVRLTPTVTPRFAVSCSDQCLSTASGLVANHTPIQTHLAESTRECELVAELYPADPHYTAVYDRHGMLTPRTLLAHCVHLNEDEWRLIAERQSVVVHCPTANTFLESGVFDLTAALRHGVRLALGSDVAGGPDVAMPRVARAMIETAKHRRMTIDPETPIPTPAEAWRQITAGNADSLGWSDAGRLAIGAAADLLVLRAPFDVDDYLVSRLLYTWNDTYITDRIVAGRPLDPEQSAEPEYTT